MPTLQTYTKAYIDANFTSKAVYRHKVIFTSSGTRKSLNYVKSATPTYTIGTNQTFTWYIWTNRSTLYTNFLDIINDPGLISMASGIGWAKKWMTGHTGGVNLGTIEAYNASGNGPAASFNIYPNVTISDDANSLVRL